MAHIIVVSVTKAGQKVNKLPHFLPAKYQQTRPPGFLRLHKDGNFESFICSTCVCKVPRWRKWDGAAPEYKTYPYSIAGLTHDG